MTGMSCCLSFLGTWFCESGQFEARLGKAPRRFSVATGARKSTAATHHPTSFCVGCDSDRNDTRMLRSTPQEIPFKVLQFHLDVRSISTFSLAAFAFADFQS